MISTQTSFEPQAVNDYFMGITQLPHPSKNQQDVTGDEDPVRQYVVDEAQKLSNVEVAFYQKDAEDAGNRVVILRRKGAGKYAGKTPVILQAHLDMVYNPANMTFPLNVIDDTSRQDGKWIKAKSASGVDSTLGADDGLGVATALAILKDSRFQDYPIECLFTVQEETDMGGAQNCDLKNLTGDKLLNLDAEDLQVIIFGSAGGAETNFNKSVSRFTSPTGYVARKISISGLTGGHSGLDINKCRMNAIKAMGQILSRLDKRMNNLDIQGEGMQSYDLYIQDMKRTDILKSNAIPTAAEAIVIVPGDQAASFERDVATYWETLKTQYQPTENPSKIKCTIEEFTQTVTPLDNKSTDGLLCLLAQIPSGMIAMIPGVPDVVETSSNLYNIALSNDNLLIASSNRSSNDDALAALNAVQSNIGKILGCGVETGIDGYVSWQPDYNSQILALTEGVYNEAYKGDYKSTVIHAGLECGTLASRFEAEKQIKLDCVSIGPNVKNPHTGNETMQIESSDGKQTVQEFYNCVCQTISAIFN